MFTYRKPWGVPHREMDRIGEFQEFGGFVTNSHPGQIGPVDHKGTPCRSGFVNILGGQQKVYIPTSMGGPPSDNGKKCSGDAVSRKIVEILESTISDGYTMGDPPWKWKCKLFDELNRAHRRPLILMDSHGFWHGQLVPAGTQGAYSKEHLP